MHNQSSSHEPFGHIIFLNGPSSAGKTTLTKFLQDTLPEPYMHIGIDKVIGMMPQHLNDWQGGKAEHGFWWKKNIDPQGHDEQHIQVGPFAQKVSLLLKDFVVTMAHDGFNVIVDEVCIEKEDYKLWHQKLNPFKVVYVGVQSPLDILEQRERERGNRMIGSARAQSRLVHANKLYDVTIDTSKLSLQECTNIILEYLQFEQNKKGCCT